MSAEVVANLVWLFSNLIAGLRYQDKDDCYKIDFHLQKTRFFDQESVRRFTVKEGHLWSLPASSQTVQNERFSELNSFFKDVRSCPALHLLC